MAYKKQKPNAFTIVVDRERERVLFAAFEALTHDDQRFPLLYAQGRAETLIYLLKEFTQKVGEMNWCQDPQCQHHNEKNN